MNDFTLKLLPSLGQSPPVVIELLQTRFPFALPSGGLLIELSALGIDRGTECLKFRCVGLAAGRSGQALETIQPFSKPGLEPLERSFRG